MQAHPQCLSAQLSVNIGEDRKQPTTFQIIGAIIINHNHYNFIIGLLMKCAIIIIIQPLQLYKRIAHNQQ